MQSSSFTTAFKPKQLVRHSETAYVLTFDIEGIDFNFRDELEGLLNSDVKYDGYISLKTFGCRIYQAVYETTDMYGFDIEYKVEIAQIIDACITKLAEQNGGFRKILID